MKQKLKSSEKIKAAVIGGSGYTGLELLKVLSAHRCVDIVFATSKTYKGLAVADAFPSVFPSFSEIFVKKSQEKDDIKSLDYNKFNGLANKENHFKEFINEGSINNKNSNIRENSKKNLNQLIFTVIDDVPEAVIKSLDIIFLCLPPLESMEFINKYLGNFGGVIIDIGSDFRLKNPENFKKWYGAEHILKDILKDFVYGLPEIYEEKIKNARLIANPGCYPTSVILALAPILNDKDIAVSNINIDSKSGVSGAGRKLKNEYLFCNVNENFFAYSAVMHRHIGEIEQEIENISGRNINVCFTPHLLPVNRGIFTSIYCRVDLYKESSAASLSAEGDLSTNSGLIKISGSDLIRDSGLIKKIEIDKEGKTLTNKVASMQKLKEEKAAKIKEKVSDAFNSFYSDSYFVRFTGERIPQLKDVAGTNMCHIGFAYDDRTKVLKLFSIIDNLLKGAAGQAVQNMNLIFNFDEREGLQSYGIFS